MIYLGPRLKELQCESTAALLIFHFFPPSAHDERRQTTHGKNKRHTHNSDTPSSHHHKAKDQHHYNEPRPSKHGKNQKHSSDSVTPSYHKHRAKGHHKRLTIHLNQLAHERKHGYHRRGEHDHSNILQLFKVGFSRSETVVKRQMQGFLARVLSL